MVDIGAGICKWEFVAEDDNVVIGVNQVYEDWRETEDDEGYEDDGYHDKDSCGILWGEQL